MMMQAETWPVFKNSYSYVFPKIFHKNIRKSKKKKIFEQDIIKNK